MNDMSDQCLPSVRPSIPGDAAQMCDLLNEIIAIGGTTAHEMPLSAEAVLEHYITGYRVITSHVALDADGDVAGFQFLARNPELPYDCGDIATFARQTCRVRGSGTALFAATKAVAQSAGLSQINAQIRADNRPGLAYYAKMGFQDRSVIRGVPLKNGTPVDRIVKRYALA